MTETPTENALRDHEQEMRNQAMARKLKSGACLDLATIADPYEGDDTFLDGTFVLRQGAYVDGKDYCHAPTERWVWSIGLRNGICYASFDARFYQNDQGFDCLWLR